MKLVALWLAVGLALACGGCSVSHRSSDFACTTQADCSAGRSCVDGFCVIAADGGADGPPADAAVCPAQCTSCDLARNSCTIDCALGDGCAVAVSCPAGFSCHVLCSQPDRCNSGVSCANSTSCTVACSGRQSCRSVTCGLGACNVSCTGNGSCGDVACGTSCGCDVSCRLNSCTTVTCKPGCDSTSAFGGCSSTSPGCNICK